MKNDAFQTGVMMARQFPELSARHIGIAAHIYAGSLAYPEVSREQAMAGLNRACDFIDGFYSVQGVIVEAEVEGVSS